MKSEGEAFYSCEQWLERVTDLRRAGGLPAERLALYLHKERMRARAFGVRVHNHRDKLFVEVQLGGAEPERDGCAYELEQATEVECELVEEFNFERKEEWSVDSGQDTL